MAINTWVDTNVPTGKYGKSQELSESWCSWSNWTYFSNKNFDPTELIFPTRMLIQLNVCLMFKTATMAQSSTDLHVTQNHQIWQTLWKTKMAENTIKNILFRFHSSKMEHLPFFRCFSIQTSIFWGDFPRQRWSSHRIFRCLPHRQKAGRWVQPQLGSWHDGTMANNIG